MNESLEDCITIVLKSGCQVTINGPEQARRIIKGIEQIDYFKSRKDREELNVKLVDYLADLAVWATELEARCATLEKKYITLRQGAEEYDSLTGLYTRRCLGEVVERETLKAQRYELPLSMVILKIYGLESLGESQGKSAVDHIMRTAADIVRCSTRGSDVASRYAEDEFAVLLPMTERKNGMTVARRIHLKLNSELYSEGITSISASTTTFEHGKSEDAQMFMNRIDRYVGEPQSLEDKTGS